MEEKTKDIYSEVYSILNLLGSNYINKLPTTLFNMIEKERNKDYNPIYNKDVKLEEQNINKKSLSMIALFHLNYWCNSDEEKEELRTLFKSNEENYELEIREKYNPKDIFLKGEVTQKPIEMVVYKEESVFKKFINKIKNIFKFKSCN